jgi:hypothetical protein
VKKNKNKKEKNYSLRLKSPDESNCNYFVENVKAGTSYADFKYKNEINFNKNAIRKVSDFHRNGN